MLQCIHSMTNDQFKKTAWIDITEEDTMANLYLDLNKLEVAGYEYVFIDEITKAKDFIRVSALLSDSYALSGIRIVFTGDESFGIYLSEKSELFDRVYLIHSNYMPYKEYKTLFPKATLDEYIDKGGLLFDLDEQVQYYVHFSVVENIQRSLSKVKDRGGIGPLYQVYLRGELMDVIDHMIEHQNYIFTFETILHSFESSDLNSLLGIQAEHFKKVITDRLRSLHSSACLKTLNLNQITQIKTYLEALDFIDYFEVMKIGQDIELSEYPIVVQPTIRYNQAKVALKEIEKDGSYMNLSDDSQQYIKQKLLSDIKGRMLAEIILYNTKRSIEQSNDNKKVFKLVFSEYENSPFTNGEYDMVILDDNGDIDLYEIKHTSHVYYDQRTNHLKDNQKLQYLIRKGYRIGRKIVLYNGDSLPLNSDGIEYINVDYYLHKLI